MDCTMGPPGLVGLPEILTVLILWCLQESFLSETTAPMTRIGVARLDFF